MAKEVILQKQEVVNDILKHLKDAKSTTIVEYRGIRVERLEALRKELRKEGAFVKVYKNTLTERAVKDLGHDLANELKGPNALVFSYNDAVSAPRILTKFAKAEKSLVLKGGIVEGKVVNANEMVAVAKLPSREGLYAMLLSCLQAPVRKFACTVKAVADAK